FNDDYDLQMILGRLPNNYPFSITYEKGSLKASIRTTSGSFFTYIPSTYSSVEFNHWYHIVLTYQDGEFKIYLDGTEDYSSSFSGSPSLTLGSKLKETYVGRYPAIEDNYFLKGLVDDIRIYNRVLSSDEIFSLYSGELSEEEPLEFVCGNNILEGDEVCDGTNLGGESCMSQFSGYGNLICLPDCSGFNVSQCEFVSCQELWVCNNWTDCIKGSRTRVCTDTNNCGTNFSRPLEIRGCNESCTENWVCSWSTCIGGIQNKICTDTNNCGTTYDKPMKESKACLISSNCGNNLIEKGEFCDGGDLGGDSCVDLGFDSGVLGCLSDCSGFDTSQCILDMGEECVGLCANKNIKQVQVKSEEKAVEGLETLIQSPAEINEDVKWIKKIKMSDSIDRILIDVPEDSSFVRLRKFVDSLTDRVLTRDEIKKLKRKLEDSSDLLELQDAGTKASQDVYLDEEYISDDEKNIILAFLNSFSSFFKQLGAEKLEAYISEDEKGLNVVIKESFDEIEIEYYTEAPRAVEKDISEYKKEVMVYSKKGLNYKNVLAYTKLKEVTSNAKDIKIYWNTEEGQKEITEFNLFDNDGDSLFDKIEWVVPHLSNQTFTIIQEPILESKTELNISQNYIELLVATSDTVPSKKPREEWTEENFLEERIGGAKQGYVINVKPEGWVWGDYELKPNRFAIVKIPKSDWNESWLEPEYDSQGNIKTMRKYRLPLESFLNDSELNNLRNIPYNDNSYREPIIKTINNIEDKIVLVDWENRPEDMILHGSSGTFTICPSGCNYSSLANWESGEQSDLTGTGPCIANITEGFEDTSALQIYTWTTTSSDYIKIITAPVARHNGKWDNSAYMLNVTDANAITIQESFVYLEGLQIRVSLDTADRIFITGPGGIDIIFPSRSVA
ncbi:MAG: LamG domain-containing protein, partial [Nanoarchaeota archaeon]